MIVSNGQVVNYTFTKRDGFYGPNETIPCQVIATGSTTLPVINLRTDSIGRPLELIIVNADQNVTTATINIPGGRHSNVRFINCDFGGTRIGINDLCIMDINTIKFINCKNINKTGLSQTFLDNCFQDEININVTNTSERLKLGTEAKTSVIQIGDSVQIRNQSSNCAFVGGSNAFAGRTLTFFRGSANAENERMKLDFDTGNLEVKGRLKASLASFNSNTEAIASGLQAGDFYRTSTGEVRTVI